MHKIQAKHECHPKDIALKAAFLGPTAENGAWLYKMVQRVLHGWMEWRKIRFPGDGSAITESDQSQKSFLDLRNKIEVGLEQLLSRYKEEIPTFSPRYLGHMFSEISLPALLGHWIALVHNPNLVSSESSKVGTVLEKEVIQDLVKMVGWKNGHGHFTSGGTVANYEALVRARDLHADLSNAILLIPHHRHYSWKKAAKLMGFKEEQVWQITLNAEGRVCTQSLLNLVEKSKLHNKKIIFLVSVMGSTECGVYDDIEQSNSILREQLDYRVWHHVDAAYGGFFCTVQPEESEVNLKSLYRAIQGLALVDSITLDPHKLAYVPYSCGTFLCRSVSDYANQKTDAPYLAFSPELDPGLFSIEGSRPGTGATAMWLTSKSLGLEKDGLGRILRKTIDYKEDLKKLIVRKIPEAYIVDQEGSNIICMVLGKVGEKLSEANDRANAVYDAHSIRAETDFILSKTTLAAQDYEKLIDQICLKLKLKRNTDSVVLLRFCLMNPFLITKEMNEEILENVVEELSHACSKPTS